MIHIVICDKKEKELEKIINKERKILLRGSQTRRIPHSRIFINDELYFINKGDKVCNYHAIVKNAESYSRLTEIEIERLFNKYKDKLNLTEKEEKKWKKKSICIIEFNNLEKIEDKQIPDYTLLEDWIMLEEL